MDAEYATRQRQLLDECQIAPEIFQHSELTPQTIKPLQINEKRCKGDAAFQQPQFSRSLFWRWHCA